MTKQEFEAIVSDAVKAGTDKKDAEAYVTSGFLLPVDKDGKPVFADGEKVKGGKGKKAK